MSKRYVQLLTSNSSESKKLHLSGATCDGATFTPNTKSSVWRIESSTSGHMIRLFQCPSGHRLVRDDLYPEQDNCVPCGVNEYLLAPITISNMSITCSKCPVGAYCPGTLLLKYNTKCFCNLFEY